ncbi:MAG TPA: hypothetical protein VFD25_02820 [Clostridia bacterium]|nr:hypothetical protein [Clostridia bacterium]
MKENTGCFERVLELINDANKTECLFLEADKEMLDVVKTYCDTLDVIAESLKGKIIRVEFDEDYRILVRLEFGDNINLYAEKSIFKLTDVLDKFRLLPSDNGGIIVEFELPAVWS